MRETILLYLLVVGVLRASAEPATQPSNRLTFRLVASDPKTDRALVEPLDDPLDDGHQVLVFREVLMNASDVALARPQRTGEGRSVIAVTMTEAGSQKLRDVTSANIGKRLAVVLDGKVLIAPIIHSQVSREVWIDIGGADDEEYREISRTLIEVIDSREGPTTRP